jgi:diguanylate cyclase (GGDEF)-like protein/PAS domain S-box-containing protein
MWTESPIVRGLLDGMSDGVFIVDLMGRITFWNDAAEKITGFTREFAMGRMCRNMLVHVDDDGEALCHRDGCVMACSASKQERWQKEAFLCHAEGHRIPVMINVSPLYDDDGNVIGGMEAFSDRTQHVAALHRLRELEEMVHTDALTAVGNRRATERFLRRKLDELSRYDWPFGVIFVDLDGFKEINDAHGHEAGDIMLRTISQTLEHSLRSSDFIGRWGGEEFVIIASEAGAGALLRTAERLRALVEASAGRFGGRDLKVTASIGATAARTTDTMPALVNRADRLMYVSKFSGKNRVTMEEGFPVNASDRAAI